VQQIYRIYELKLMTLHPLDQWVVPTETARVAGAAFPKGNVYMKMYDCLGQLYVDSNFQQLFPARCGQSAISPAKLALITVMQFAEGLTDRQAADAVRGRIDWKYALGLELTDQGFNFSVLSEFRSRLVNTGKSNQLLDLMLEHFKQHKLLKSRGRQRTDSSHVLAAIRQVNRLELVGEALRQALNELAVVVPEWLTLVVSRDWFDRYAVRIEQYRLPSDAKEREQLALLIGQDGHQILSTIYAQNSAPELWRLHSVEILRLVWVQQYTFVDNQLVWRQPQTTGCPPNFVCIESPYDIEARNRTKRDTNWTGYTVHLTETCDDECPNFITNVETTPATTPDGALTQKIHATLATKDLLPKEHLLDTAYVDAQHMVKSQALYEIELVGPVPPDTSWQAQAQRGFDISCFAIDWENQLVKCPMGHSSRAWRPRSDGYGNQVIEVHFDRSLCAACPVRQDCTRAAKSPRLLKLRHQQEHQALQTARQKQLSLEFQRSYAKRAGVEGTISQGIGAFNLRRSRYIGLAKTHLQHVATAAAMNLSRLMAWWQQIPKAATRQSTFAALAAN